jgi:hypothetical protein
LAARLPTIYAFRQHVDDGGLISYGINDFENYRRLADYVVKIPLKGAPGPAICRSSFQPSSNSSSTSRRPRRSG